MSLGIRKIQLDKCDGPQANRSANERFHDTHYHFIFFLNIHSCLFYQNVIFAVSMLIFNMISFAICSWELVCAEEANDADGEVQRLSMDIPPRVTASYLRFRVCLSSTLSVFPRYIFVHLKLFLV